MRTRTQYDHSRKVGSAIHLFLAVMLIGMTSALASGQASSGRQQTESPSSTPARQMPLEKIVTSPCRLRVSDSNLLLPSGTKETVTTNETLIYTPLSARCKFDLFLTTTRSPYTFLSAGFEATLDQAQGQWPHYGGGMQGWGKRLGATLADTESRRLIQTFALSTILHQDPRYFPSQKRSLIARSWYAATRVVITRNDSGYNTFNTSECLGTLFTSALQNSYCPRHDRTVGDTMNRFSGALSSDALGNLLKEFTPDMKRLFREHAPKRILRIEEKLPIPADDKP